MKKILANKDFNEVLFRPEDLVLTEREIIIAYKVISQEMAEELETMPAQEALKLFKHVLLCLV